MEHKEAPLKDATSASVLRLKDYMQGLGKLCFEQPLGTPDVRNFATSLEVAMASRVRRLRLDADVAVRHQEREGRVRTALSDSAAAELTVESEEECIVCFDAKPEVVIVSCGHRVLCMKCAAEMETRRQNCPICRTRLVGDIARLV